MMTQFDCDTCWMHPRKRWRLREARKRADLDQDEQLALAVVRLLEIIGEAAMHISKKTREKHPEFPWQSMTATRNCLIHGYFDLDNDIIWNIITRDLPAIIQRLKRMLP